MEGRIVIPLLQQSPQRQAAPTRDPDATSILNLIGYYCVGVTLFTFAFMINVFGPTGMVTYRVGAGSSHLIQAATPYFIQSINAEKVPYKEIEPILYMLNKEPPLDEIRTWSDTHYASPVAGRIIEDWLYFLNKGSEMDIFYSVPSSSSLLLTITRDHEDPTARYPLFMLRQRHENIIHGNGVIHQKILQSGRYRIGVESLDSQVEVQLNITARALIYNTSEARYMCMVAQGQCSLPVLFGAESYAVLTTHLKQGISDGEWYVKLSCQPRWSAYFGGIVLVIIIMNAAIYGVKTSIKIICGLVDGCRRYVFQRSLLP